MAMETNRSSERIDNGSEKVSADDGLAGEREPLISSSGSIKINHQESFMAETIDTVRLGVPIFLASSSWAGMKTVDSALLGHVGSEALAAAALSDLWTMCSAVLIQGRALDVLVGGAVGANNPRLAGIYLQVSLVVLGVVAIFVFVAWNFTEQVWTAIRSGFSMETVIDAGYYARVLSFGIPGLVLYGQLSQYFSAQRIMHPEVSASTTALILNLILGLVFVLGSPLNLLPRMEDWYGYGFKACPIVTMCVVYVQLVIVYSYFVKLRGDYWAGWSWSELTKERFHTFSKLYFPAALSAASDFWRVAAIGAVAARLGQLEVAVFNTSYRIMWITLVFVGSLAIASSIKMSLRLGAMNAVKARKAGLVGLILAAISPLVISIIVFFNIRLFGRIFSDDNEFLDLLVEVRWPFTLTLIMMNLAVVIERVPYSMGRTTEIFWLGFIASWGAQVPAVILLCKYWRNDLIGLYTGMAVGYALLCVLYTILVLENDWERYAVAARDRSEAPAN